MENQNAVNQPSAPQKNQPEHDIYSDPALSQETRDPIADFLKQQWRPALIIVVLAFAAVYIRDTLRNSHQAGLEASANSFFKAQEALEGYKVAKKKLVELEAKPLSAEKEKSVEEEKARSDARADLAARDERLKQSTLVLSDSLEPYKKLSALINILAAKERGEQSALKALADQFKFDSVTLAKGPDRVVAELSALALARSLLDAPEGEAQGRVILSSLAREGQTVSISAALSLARLATSEDEKKQAQDLLKQIAEKHPEQASLLKEELQ